MYAKIVVVIVAALLATASAGHEWKCKGKTMKLEGELKKTMDACYSEFKERDPEGKIPDACFAACKFEKTKSVVDGKVDADAVNKFIDAEFPSEAVAEMKTGFKKCFDAVTEKLTKDDNCKSYKKLAKCSMMTAMKVCSNKEDEA